MFPVTVFRSTGAILVAALLLSGCSNRYIQQRGSRGDALAALLAGGIEVVATERCLSSHEYDHVEVLSDSRLLFIHGREAWINELNARCPQLRKHQTLIFDVHSNQLCRLDRVSSAERGLFAWRRGVACPLGDFKKLSDAQARQLAEAR